MEHINNCSSCRHYSVCKLREIRDRISEKLKDIKIVDGDKLHVDITCDEFEDILEYTPYYPQIDPQNPRPWVTWNNIRNDYTVDTTAASHLTITK